jgi:hypothetical protein
MEGKFPHYDVLDLGLLIRKRPAKPGEGEIPAGLSEVPGGGPQAFTDPETGERMIEDDMDGFLSAETAEIKTLAEASEYVQKPVKAPKPTAKRKTVK